MAKITAENGLAALVLLVSVAFVPGILHASTSPRWAVLSLGLALWLFSSQGKAEPTIGSRIGLLFVGWATLSLMWSPVAYDAAADLWKLDLLALAFLFGATVKDLKPTYIALGIGVSISGAIALLQRFGVSVVEQVASPAGLFGNRNSLAELAVLAIIPVVMMRKWWLLPGCALAVLLPLSWGALAALGAAVSVWLWERSRLAVLALALIAVVGGMALSQRGYERTSAAERMSIWQDTASGLTWLGHGIGSFYTVYPAYANHTDAVTSRLEYAHNEYLHFAFELGVGFLLVLALAFYALGGPLETERLILVALLVECFFSFPLHLPATGFVASLVAGRLCAARHALRDDFALGRSFVRAGLALGAYIDGEGEEA